MNTITVSCFCTHQGADYHPPTIIEKRKIVAEGHPGLKESLAYLEIYPQADVDLCTLAISVIMKRWRSVCQAGKYMKKYDDRTPYRVILIKTEDDEGYDVRLSYVYTKSCMKNNNIPKITWKHHP